MDRRNALLALCVLVLVACDEIGKSDCDESPSSWSSSDYVRVSGTLTLEGETFAVLTADQTGFSFTVPATSNQPLVDGGADGGGDADASDAARYGSGSMATYDLTRRGRVEIDAKRPPGEYRLEDTYARALVCRRGSAFQYYGGGDVCFDANGVSSPPERIELHGTLTVLDIVIDASQPGAPREPPYTTPWGWDMKTTNEELPIDVRAISRPTWNRGRYCND
jgi:hypothetical protein